MYLFVVAVFVSFSFAADPAFEVLFSSNLLNDVTNQINAEIEQKVAADRPPPVKSGSIELKNFQTEVLLQNFTFEQNSAGWKYWSFVMTMDYHVKDGIISESGNLVIGSTNQNQKTLTIVDKLDFMVDPPTIDVTEVVAGVAGGDAIVYGHCSDTICLVPVSKIVDGIASAFFPTLTSGIKKEVQTEGTAFLNTVHDMVKIPIGSKTLEFDGEGQFIDANNDVSYIASGATLGNVNGTKTFPPVSNTVPLPSLSSEFDMSVGLSPYFFSSFIWALSVSGDLNIQIQKAPSSSPIQLSTSNSFFKAAVPGFAKYPNLNITIALSPLFSWPQASINSTGILVGPSSWNMVLNVVNGTSVVVSNAVDLNVTVGLELAVKAAMVSNNVTLSSQIVSHTQKVQQVSSKLGTVNTAAFDALLQFAFGFASLPSFSFPISGRLSVSSVHLSMAKDILALGIDAEVKVLRRKPLRAIFVKKTDSSKEIDALLTSDTSPILSAASQLCGAGSESCADGQTCCYKTKNAGPPYSCCPSPHGTCCPQLGYCCPESYGCTSDNPPKCAPF